MRMNRGRNVGLYCFKKRHGKKVETNSKVGQGRTSYFFIFLAFAKGNPGKKTRNVYTEVRFEPCSSRF